MIFLVYSETAADNVDENLGMPEYSYFFVLKTFRPLLEEMGIVIAVQDPEHEVDRVWRNAKAHGEDCVFLSFSPPHRTFVPRECPTFPVFAWEFNTIPTEAWGEGPRDDWRIALGEAGRAITHSQFAVQAVRQAMGKDFDIISLPAPVWDNYAPLYSHQNVPRRQDWPAASKTLTVRGRVYDTLKIDLDLYAPLVCPKHVIPKLPEAGRRDEEQELKLDGVIYTSIFCPLDGRKNWLDMVSGFCWALRDHADATLVLKLTHRDCGEAIGNILKQLAKLMPFRCRVVMVDGYLSDESYMALAGASHFGLNTSHGEGECLPLMEYMSAGKPAVAPNHTSMLDYLTPRNAFLVNSNPEPTAWPHDPLQRFRALRYRIDFESLVAAFRESFETAKTDPGRYAQMAAAAHETMRGHCSRALIHAKLASHVIPQSGIARSA
jgi:glycosyltransferase involved in cell wall biosynthesis